MKRQQLANACLLAKSASGMRYKLYMVVLHTPMNTSCRAQSPLSYPPPRDFSPRPFPSPYSTCYHDLCVLFSTARVSVRRSAEAALANSKVLSVCKSTTWTHEPIDPMLCMNQLVYNVVTGLYKLNDAFGRLKCSPLLLLNTTVTNKHLEPP